MIDNENKDIRRQAWKDEFSNYSSDSLDKAKNKREGNFCIRNKSRP